MTKKNQKINFALMVFMLILLKARTIAAEEWNVQAAASLWNAGSYRNLVESNYNPDNRIIKFPDRALTSELRPEIKINNSQYRLTLRPRLMASWTQAEVSDERLSWLHSKRLQWSEAFFTANLTDDVMVSYGLQNYQWGPAEFASPSNRIFRDTLQSKDILYDVRGRHLLRMNYTWNQVLSQVVMIELTDNGEQEFEADESYQRKALAKTEYSWDGGTNYAGFVVGARNKAQGWIGEYVNYEVIEGLSVYVDASHQRGSKGWYAEKKVEKEADAAIVRMVQNKENESRIYTFSASGLRYAFEGGEDLRFEWLFQEAGYSSAQSQQFWSSTQSTEPQQLRILQDNVRHFEKKGLEFTGRQMGLVSLRVPNIFDIKDSTVYARSIFSLQDGSTSSYISNESAIGESGTLLSAVSATSGSDDSELRGFVAVAVLLGYRHAW